jgi:cytochrome c oxidase cbb3-type subunit I/II
MIRSMLAETKRYGEYSKAGEFVYDHPFQWGSRRIGPDLAREGGRQSVQWHILHFANPRQMTPNSIMPVYAHLIDRKLDYNSIPVRMRAMQALGVPYDDAAVENAVTAARTQAEELAATFEEQNAGPYVGDDGKAVALAERRVIAIVAYLERLGRDLYAEVQVAAEEPDADSDREQTARLEPEVEEQ